MIAYCSDDDDTTTYTATTAVEVGSWEWTPAYVREVEGLLGIEPEKPSVWRLKGWRLLLDWRRPRVLLNRLLGWCEYVVLPRAPLKLGRTLLRRLPVWEPPRCLRVYGLQRVSWLKAGMGRTRSRPFDSVN